MANRCAQKATLTYPKYEPSDADGRGEVEALGDVSVPLPRRRLLKATRINPICREAWADSLTVIAKVAADCVIEAIDHSHQMCAPSTRAVRRLGQHGASAPRARRPSRARFRVLILVRRLLPQHGGRPPRRHHSMPPLPVRARHVMYWKRLRRLRRRRLAERGQRLCAVQLGRGLLLLVETDGAATYEQPRWRGDQRSAAAN